MSHDRLLWTQPTRPTTTLPAPMLHGSALPNAPSTSPASRRPRILVLEDNAESRLLLRHLLARAFEAEIVARADDALEHARRVPFDLMLLDINLGEKRTGVDVLAELRRLPGYADVPALACTAYALPGDRERFLAAGFQGYVSKPFVKAELLGALGAAVEGR